MKRRTFLQVVGAGLAGLFVKPGASNESKRWTEFLKSKFGHWLDKPDGTAAMPGPGTRSVWSFVKEGDATVYIVTDTSGKVYPIARYCDFDNLPGVPKVLSETQ